MMNLKDAEAIYPLSPIQEDLLLDKTPHSQLTCLLKASINCAAFEAACQMVVARHPILRTSFVWKRVEKPLQVVRKQIRFDLERDDWRGLDALQQEERLGDFLRADRDAAFNHAAAPLMRINLIRVAESAYRLIWSYHPLLLDEISVKSLLKEVLGIYERGGLDQDEPRWQYRDYVKWVRQKDKAQAEMFWRASLARPTSAMEVRIGEIRASRPDERKTSHCSRKVFPDDLRLRVERCAGNCGIAVSTLVMGAWAVLLGRYGGAERVVFCVRVDVRPEEVEGARRLIGPVENLLPLCVDLDEGAEVLAWLKTLDNHARAGRQYGYAPLGWIRAWSGIEDAPLAIGFEVEPGFRHWPLKMVVSDLEVKRGLESQVRLKLEWGDQAALTIQDESHDLEGWVSEQMVGQLARLIESMVARPGARIRELNLLTEEERAEAVTCWNGTICSYEGPRTIHNLFEQRLAGREHATATEFGAAWVTYGELNVRANKLASYLRARGIRPETIVGICLERSIEMIVALLGVLKAGSAFLPIDPSYPAERIAFMLEDSESPVILTDRRLAQKLPAHWGQEICLDEDWGLIARSEGASPDGWACSRNLAYVMYTSGSTGKPKGVMVEHEGICNLALAQIEAFNVTPDSRVLQLASFCFDASISEIFVALISGAALCLGRQEELLPGPGLIERINNRDITTATIPPSLLATLPEEDLPTLRTLVVAGEACPVDLMLRWSKGRHFINAYGPTEVTVCATMHQGGERNGKLPIGRPMANTQVYILDSQLRPLPVGVSGEIYIGGVGLARGYLRQPQLTAEQFIPHSFSRGPGAQLYSSGDLARYLPGGDIEFLGRRDCQVKIRGLRIELRETEAALLAHHRVGRAIAMVREDAPGDRRLVAYVVPRENETLATDDLRAFLRKKMPEYMVPTSFVALDKLPLNGNGKVDYHALPAPGRGESQDGFVAPRNQIEETIAGIWLQLLGKDPISVTDNFFELGGHSLMIGQALSRVQQTLGIELPLNTIFDAPTVAELAAVIEQIRASEIKVSRPKIEARPRGDGSLNQLLIQLEQLSEEEARQALKQKGLPAEKEVSR